jgi:hypothetical protein
VRSRGLRRPRGAAVLSQRREQRLAAAARTCGPGAAQLPLDHAPDGSLQRLLFLLHVVAQRFIQAIGPRGMSLRGGLRGRLLLAVISAAWVFYGHVDCLGMGRDAAEALNGAPKRR